MATQLRSEEYETEFKRGRGRPSLRTPELMEEICERLSLDESLASICRSEHMPTETTVYRWMQEDNAFREAYRVARENQAHTVVDTLGQLRKDVLAGLVPPDVARVAGDLAKWEAGRRAAKYYGDSTMLKHANADGEVIKAAIDPSHLTADERDQLRALMLAAQQRALAPPVEDGEFEEVGDDE